MYRLTVTFADGTVVAETLPSVAQCYRRWVQLYTHGATFSLVPASK